MVPPRTSLKAKDLEAHATQNTCWIAVHGTIYDITDYLPSHPGGAEIILKYAGKDATPAYDEIHAPSIIEEALAPDKVMGKLDEADVLSKPRKAQANLDHVEANPQRLASKGEYSKPALSTILSAHDFESVAEQVLSPKAWAFYSSAADDLIAHYDNGNAFRQLMFRPRVMRDVTRADTSTTILGCSSSAPFFVAPAAQARLADKEGELAIARACHEENVIQCISSNASHSLSSIVKAGAAGQPFFFQLYVNSDRAKSTQLLHQAKELGVKAIFVTLDAPVAGKREKDERVSADNAVSSGITGVHASNDKKGGGMGRLMGQYIDKALIWEDIDWIRTTSGLPVVLKGIQCAADAKLAVEHGCKGVVLSNHGGRNLDTAPPSIVTLLEIHKWCPEIIDQIEIYVDGGVTRGSDILKALCLGARAVGIGRPFLYSLCYGQEGCQHLINIFKDELMTNMRLCGIRNLEEAHPAFINTGRLDHLIPETSEHPWISWRPKSRL